MKFRFAAIAALLLAANSAFAAFTNTPQSGVASDLFLVIVNQTTGKSEVIDLGVTATALTNGQSISIDPNYATTLGAGTLTYQIVGGDISNAALNGLAGQIMYVSGNTQYSGTTQIQALTIQNMLGSVDTYLNAATSTSSLAGLTSYVSAGTAATNWGPTNAAASAPGKSLGQGNTFDFTAAVGSALGLYSYATSPTGSDTATQASTVTKLGTFTLTGSTLTFATAPVSNVPVPAAVWLLSSGLLGLGAARRRRSAVVAA